MNDTTDVDVCVCVLVLQKQRQSIQMQGSQQRRIHSNILIVSPKCKIFFYRQQSKIVHSMMVHMRI